MFRIAIAMLLVASILPAAAGCRSDMAAATADAALHAGEVLPDGDWRRLKEAGWESRVGEDLGLWVSVARQQLVGVERGRVRFAYTCSTAARGIGSEEGSNRTPAGWHEVAEKIGDGLPKGAVLAARKFTGDVWRPGEATVKDLVLSRILWLDGLEPGVNRGPGIDSHDRYIYIHGTPAEDKLGTPASMGCVRLSNADVIELFDRCPTGTRVLITEW